MAARAVGVVGAEHPHELADTTLVALEPAHVGARGCADVSLTIEKWRSASEAICGRWVMHSSWRCSPSSRSCSPTARAVWPPIPASISSNTS